MLADVWPDRLFSKLSVNRKRPSMHCGFFCAVQECLLLHITLTMASGKAAGWNSRSQSWDTQRMLPQEGQHRICCSQNNLGAPSWPLLTWEGGMGGQIRCATACNKPMPAGVAIMIHRLMLECISVLAAAPEDTKCAPVASCISTLGEVHSSDVVATLWNR